MLTTYLASAQLGQITGTTPLVCAESWDQLEKLLSASRQSMASEIFSRRRENDFDAWNLDIAQRNTSHRYKQPHAAIVGLLHCFLMLSTGINPHSDVIATNDDIECLALLVSIGPL